MMMTTGQLWLIGIGPGPIESMTSAAIKAAKKADRRMLEGYTSIGLHGGISELENEVGPVEIIRRPAIEQPNQILELAENEKIAILVHGDPFVSTTHSDLILRAKEKGIHTVIIHGISVLDLIGKVGLQSSKFGRQITLPYPYGEHLPTSPFEMLALNYWLGQHTLVLLDLDPTGIGVTDPMPMTPKTAVEVLRSMEKKIQIPDGDSTINEAKSEALRIIVKEGIENVRGVICCDLGSNSERIYQGKIRDFEFVTPGKIHCIIVPSNLHQIEKEALSNWSTP